MTSHLPSQADVDALRGLLDLVASFPTNDQRARYLLTCNWMRDRQQALQNACRAALAFHSGEPWTIERAAEWARLTGQDSATTRILCDTIRAALAESEGKVTS